MQKFYEVQKLDYNKDNDRTLVTLARYDVDENDNRIEVSSHKETLEGKVKMKDALKFANDRIDPELQGTITVVDGSKKSKKDVDVSDDNDSDTNEDDE